MALRDLFVAPRVGVKPEKRWVEAPRRDSWQEFYYVDEMDEILASIVNFTHEPAVWKVYRRGSRHGEFLTKEAAIAKAERIA